MNFGRISERLMKLAVSMNLPQVDATNPSSFTVLECQRRAIPTFRYTHSRGRQLCKFLGTKGSFYLRKEFNPHRIFLYINMAAVLLFCTPVWPPWRHVTTICRATGRVVFKTSENFSKRSLHFIFHWIRWNVTGNLVIHQHDNQENHYFFFPICFFCEWVAKAKGQEEGRSERHENVTL